MMLRRKSVSSALPLSYLIINIHAASLRDAHDDTTADQSHNATTTSNMKGCFIVTAVIGRPPRQWPPEGQRSVTRFSFFFFLFMGASPQTPGLAALEALEKSTPQWWQRNVGWRLFCVN
jgi:hypothetical protein